MKKNTHVSHIMHANPVTAHLGQKPSEAQAAMMNGGFHHLPVVDGKKLVGIITSTDLLRASYEYGVDSRQTATVLDHTRTLADLMQPNPVFVNPDDTVRHATTVLAEGFFHALPVVEGGDLVGIITTTDLLKFYVEQY